MDLKKVFAAIDEQKQYIKKRAESIEARTEKFLKLVALAFQFDYSLFSLSTEQTGELIDQKDFMLKTEAELKEKDGVDELVFIFDAVDGPGRGLKDLHHPCRNSNGSYVVNVPTSFSTEVGQAIEKRAVEAEQKPAEIKEYSKEELIDNALYSYCNGTMLEAAAGNAGLSISEFKLQFKKFSRNRAKMETYLGPRWRNRAESMGLLEPTPGRQKLIEDVGNQRMEGLSVVALSKKFKVSLGVVTSILGDFRNRGQNWLYERYFQQYGEEWAAKAQIAFDHRLYMVGVKDEFLAGNKTEKQFQEQQTNFRFKDGYILA